MSQEVWSPQQISLIPVTPDFDVGPYIIFYIFWAMIMHHF